MPSDLVLRNQNKFASFFYWLSLTNIVYLVSRIILLSILPFDSSPLYYYRQYADLHLLQTKLLETVYYMHSQPPLFNLGLGIILKAFPIHYHTVFSAIYFVLGIIFCNSFFALLIRLRIPLWLSAILTVIFFLNPSVMLYEKWLFYTYPLAVMLCVSVLFLHKFLQQEKWKDAFIFFSLLCAVILTRSVFHVFWIFIIAAIVLVFKPSIAKKILLAAILPLLITCFFYAKNLIVFHTANMGSAYASQGVAELVKNAYSLGYLKKLAAENKISKLSLIPTFSPVSRYKGFIPEQKTGADILDQDYKINSRVSPFTVNNYHHRTYLDISKIYFRDARYIIRSNPQPFFYYLAKLYYRQYFLPSSYVWPFTANKLPAGENKSKLTRYSKIYNRLFCGQGFSSSSDISLFMLFGFPLLLIYALLRIYQDLSHHRNLSEALTILFMFITIMNVNLACLFTWEHHRFRFMIDAFYFFLAANLGRDLILEGKSFISRFQRKTS